MYAAEQEKPLEREIANYVRQHPTTPPNRSAIELQSLMAKLGLSVEVFNDGSKVKVKPDKAAIAEWKAIEPIFDKYKDKQSSQEKLEPIPDRLVKYLHAHQAEIDAIETHLVNNPVATWGDDYRWIEQGDLKAGDSVFSNRMNTLSLSTLENLLLINVVDKHQSVVSDLSKDLIAIEKLQQSLQSQPSFRGQFRARIGEAKISKLIRQIDRIPSNWGNNLFGSERHQQMMDALNNNSIFKVRMLQDANNFNVLLKNSDIWLKVVPGYHSLARPQIILNPVIKNRI